MTIKERINEGSASRGEDLLDGKKMLIDTVLGAKGASRIDKGRLGIKMIFSIN
jgi:hypothetical protein